MMAHLVIQCFKQPFFRNDGQILASFFQGYGFLNFAPKAGVNPVPACCAANDKIVRFARYSGGCVAATRFNQFVDEFALAVEKLTGGHESSSVEINSLGVFNRELGGHARDFLVVDSLYRARRASGRQQQVYQFLLFVGVEHTVFQHFCEAWVEHVVRPLVGVCVVIRKPFVQILRFFYHHGSVREYSATDAYQFVRVSVLASCQRVAGRGRAVHRLCHGQVLFVGEKAKRISLYLQGQLQGFGGGAHLWVRAILGAVPAWISNGRGYLCLISQ